MPFGFKNAQLVVDERLRQIGVEGWSFAHDDAHTDRSLAAAAACYAMAAARPGFFARASGGARALPWGWPTSWDWKWWKPSETGNARRDLIKAGALILAELERLDRKEARNETLKVKQTGSDENSPRVIATCPKCGADEESRERRPNGNSRCANGHTYPSANAGGRIKNPPREAYDTGPVS